MKTSVLMKRMRLLMASFGIAFIACAAAPATKTFEWFGKFDHTDAESGRISGEWCVIAEAELQAETLSPPGVPPYGTRRYSVRSVRFDIPFSYVSTTHWIDGDGNPHSISVSEDHAAHLGSGDFDLAFDPSVLISFGCSHVVEAFGVPSPNDQYFSIFLKRDAPSSIETPQGAVLTIGGGAPGGKGGFTITHSTLLDSAAPGKPHALWPPGSDFSSPPGFPDVVCLAEPINPDPGRVDLTCGVFVYETTPSAKTPPTASFEFSPLRPVVGVDTVEFDAGTSTDPDGWIVSYAWDFENDGFVDTEGLAEVQTTHVFKDRVGRFQVKLTVIDDDGLESSVVRDVEVVLCDDRPDRADFWVIDIPPLALSGQKLESEAGQILQVFYRDLFGKNPRYELIFAGVGGSPAGRIAGCKWSGGMNWAVAWGPDSNGNGKPDFFRQIFWESIDGGEDDDHDRKLDVWRFTYDVCANMLSQHWYKYPIYRCGPPVPRPLPPGCRCPYGGIPAVIPGADPPLGPETEAFFDAWFAGRPINSTTDISMGPFEHNPADLNWDGVLDRADFELITGAIGASTNSTSCDPSVDLDLDGIVTLKDMRFLAAGDSDDDGAADWQEYVAGTDAFEKGSALRITRVARRASGAISLEWSSSNTRTYTVFRSADPSFANPHVLAEDLPATPPANTFTDLTASDSASAFYRVVATFSIPP